MAENQALPSRKRKVNVGYWVTISATILFSVALWFFLGMAAGYGLFFTIHEWGMFWLIPMVIVLPTVVFVALFLAFLVPKLAIKRDYNHPHGLAIIAVLLWFIITFVSTLAILNWALN